MNQLSPFSRVTFALVKPLHRYCCNTFFLSTKKSDSQGVTIRSLTRLHAAADERSVKITAPPNRILRGNELRLPASITALGGSGSAVLMPP